MEYSPIGYGITTHNNMKKIIIGILIALAILFSILKGLEWWIESNFQAIINSNPDRAYNITYADLDLFFRGITLDQVSIEPLNLKTRTLIRGQVEYTSFNGLVWKDLLFSKRLNLNEVDFEQPKFEVTLSADASQETSGQGLQSMFGDILSRANINNFRIDNGSVVLIDPTSKTVKGHVKHVSILATGINTDSVKFAQLIPFEMYDLEVNLDSIYFQLKDYSYFRLAHFKYKLRDKKILLHEISLGYSIDWIEVSKRIGIQKDIVELNAKEMGIHQFEPSDNFYTQLDIVAQKISVDELNIKVHRNKNYPRPPNTAKPTFQGIVNAIPIAFLIDSVQISHSSLCYDELAVKNNEYGSIKIQEINGNITGLTNMPEHQKSLDQIDARIEGRLAAKAEINIALNIPYASETFSLDLGVGKMEMKNLNNTLKPLTGIEIISGQMRQLSFHMDAGRYQSQNNLVFDYEDLHVNMINKKSKNKKKALLSTLVNVAIRENNLPEQRKYLIAHYQSKRNIHRSPINYIIQSLFQGIRNIVPGKLAQKMVVKNGKRNN